MSNIALALVIVAPDMIPVPLINQLKIVAEGWWFLSACPTPSGLSWLRRTRTAGSRTYAGIILLLEESDEPVFRLRLPDDDHPPRFPDDQGREGAT